jgi:hypothetical protein
MKIVTARMNSPVHELLSVKELYSELFSLVGKWKQT